MLGGYDIGAFQLCLAGRPPLQMPCIPSVSGNPPQTEPLTIQASPSAGGTTNPAPGTYNPAMNSVIPLTATLAPTYAFALWQGNVVDFFSNPTTVFMNNPQSVTAIFTQVICMQLGGRGTAGLFGRGDRIDLSWTPSATATSYNVLRGTSPGGENPVPIGTPATTAYTDTNGLVSGTTYYYVVQAVSGGVPVCASNEAAVKAP